MLWLILFLLLVFWLLRFGFNEDHFFVTFGLIGTWLVYAGLLIFHRPQQEQKE